MALRIAEAGEFLSPAAVGWRSLCPFAKKRRRDSVAVFCQEARFGPMMVSAVPLLEPGQCQIWWADSAAAAGPLLQVLEEGEQARWSRFLRQEDRGLYLAGHAALRLVLAAHLQRPARDIRFSTVCRYCGRDHGKPRLQGADEDLEFSLSHSGFRAVLAVARGLPLGIDVEHVKPERDRASLIAAVLSESERPAIEDLPAPEQGRAFLRYWTRKEALLKATGHGLAVAPASITVTAHDEAPALISWTAESPLEAPAHLFDLAAPADYVAALAVLGARPRLVECDAGALLAAA